jgi:hypothetical protein
MPAKKTIPGMAQTRLPELIELASQSMGKFGFSICETKIRRTADFSGKPSVTISE